VNTLAHIGEVRNGKARAQDWARASLESARAKARLCAFTSLLEEDAMAQAACVDASPADRPLAGMPFAAKNLFDVAGHPTLAGARINRDAPPARRTATVISRLANAGATLVGMTNMDEFAYGFATENAHFGATRNPCDETRMAGGSSGGSAAAVAAGIVPVALGSDTNGSIRVPASLCGIYGLKPTFGRLSRAGTYPFVSSLDHVGPFARTLDDLALSYDAMQGADGADPACSRTDPDPIAADFDVMPSDLRVGVLGGWFIRHAAAEAKDALDLVAGVFAQASRVELQGAQAARSAAFCMTGIEGGSLHIRQLATRPMDYDPAVRDRLLAGLLLPARVSELARRMRRQFIDEVAQLFGSFHILISPTTPCSAPRIGEACVEIDGVELPVRANLGLYTQPISFAGLPALSVPLKTDGLPIGMQLIAPYWAEKRLFQVARWLERQGVVASGTVQKQEAVL